MFLYYIIHLDSTMNSTIFKCTLYTKYFTYIAERKDQKSFFSPVKNLYTETFE